MTLKALPLGFLALLAVLIGASAIGNIGPVELTIWLVLALAWTTWWLLSRRTRPSSE